MTAPNHTDNDPTAELTLFSAIITPHRSLSGTGFLAVMALVGGFSFIGGMFFFLLGAWPVIGFLGLDVVLDDGGDAVEGDGQRGAHDPTRRLVAPGADDGGGNQRDRHDRGRGAVEHAVPEPRKKVARVRVEQQRHEQGAARDRHGHHEVETGVQRRNPNRFYGRGAICDARGARRDGRGAGFCPFQTFHARRKPRSSVRITAYSTGSPVKTFTFQAK